MIMKPIHLEESRKDPRLGGLGTAEGSGEAQSEK